MTSRRILETKYRISETAMALFLEEGYENVTVEAVAEASRVSRRTVFRHFESKDELAFPDHTERLGLVQRSLVESDPDTDPVEAVIAATEESLRDFLGRPELVLRRYKLTRVVPELRKREVIEHERYVTLTRSFLRDHLPPDTPPFQPMGLAALIDAIHRSALGNWARSGGATDAIAELEAGMEWIRRLMVHQSAFSTAPLLLAVLPDAPQTRRVLSSLKDAAEELL
ncbi:TetR/AcrR family transcriptional regulator [Actinomadura sp. HBU206391]|uniref:TetR/AcrR family transcriptional regulator n=1 Tax=Actinomadura sp. HBU206391 TaxID=2731692 RepID=UPI00164F3D0E|nr:TetR/AcrR family transcriptional regulator [Actinomadura sp. HBU206391]MBC6463282.1 TetR family transcriptional regulator [Actinomadura sp. HBU206391]